MNTTVILCTYNRGQSLARALESIARSDMPAAMQWNVLVVDNNSKDQTREVVESFCRRFPGKFTYLFEPKQGKSYALNAGIERATGDVLAFTDDDVEADPHWLYNLTAPFKCGEWAGVAGRILPEADFSAPAWLDTSARYSMAPLAIFDPAMPAGKIEEPPIGANMAYRREMFSRYGGFRLDLGPQPGGETKNEDVELGARLLAAGETIWYEPSAIVHHVVPHHRVRKSYFLTWWFGKGRSDTRQLGTVRDGLSLCGVPLVLFRRLVVWFARWLLGSDPSQRFDAQVKVWWLSGIIRESFGQFSKGAQSQNL